MMLYSGYMVGLFFGSLLSSYPADRFGRKIMLFVFVIIAGGFNLIGAEWKIGLKHVKLCRGKI